MIALADEPEYRVAFSVVAALRGFTLYEAQRCLLLVAEARAAARAGRPELLCLAELTSARDVPALVGAQAIALYHLLRHLDPVDLDSAAFREALKSVLAHACIVELPASPLDGLPLQAVAGGLN